ncbi:MAG: PDZ domain-containing protein, partial [Pseudomonadota bacterium]
VRAVVDQAKGGSDAFERPYIGARFDEVTSEMAESLGMNRPAGAIVVGVMENGPAAESGLSVGDVVLAINDQRIEHKDALGYRLATLAIGDVVDLDVFSRGELVSIRLKLASRPPEAQAQTVSLDGRGPFSGAEVSDISSEIRSQLRLSRETTGVVIIDIQRGSPANRAGFRPGDIIEIVNGTAITDVTVMQQVVAQGGRSWRFRLNRGGRRIQQFLRF